MNAVTDSLRIRVPRTLNPTESAFPARQSALFDLNDTAPLLGAGHPLRMAAAALHRIQALSLRVSGAYPDLKSGVFPALLTPAARQLCKPQFRAPGFTFFWYVLTLLMME